MLQVVYLKYMQASVVGMGCCVAHSGFSIRLASWHWAVVRVPSCLPSQVGRYLSMLSLRAAELQNGHVQHLGAPLLPCPVRPSHQQPPPPSSPPKLKEENAPLPGPLSLRSASLRLLHSQLQSHYHYHSSHRGILPFHPKPPSPLAKGRHTDKKRPVPIGPGQARTGQCKARASVSLLRECVLRVVLVCCVRVCVGVCAGPHVGLTSPTLGNLTLTSLLSRPPSGRLPAYLDPFCHANAHVDGASLPSRAQTAAALAAPAAAADHPGPELELSCLGPVHAKLVLLPIHRSLLPPPPGLSLCTLRAREFDHWIMLSLGARPTHISRPSSDDTIPKIAPSLAAFVFLLAEPAPRTLTASNPGQAPSAPFLPHEAVPTKADLGPVSLRTPIGVPCHSDPFARRRCEPTQEPRLYPLEAGEASRTQLRQPLIRNPLSTAPIVTRELQNIAPVVATASHLRPESGYGRIRLELLDSLEPASLLE